MKNVITLIWTEDAQGLNDKQIREFVRQLFIDDDECEQNICFSQSIVSLAVRAYMARNKIPCEKVVFKVGDDIIQVTKGYRLSYHPKEFDIFDDCLDDILDL